VLGGGSRLLRLGFLPKQQGCAHTELKDLAEAAEGKRRATHDEPSLGDAHPPRHAGGNRDRAVRACGESARQGWSFARACGPSSSIQPRIEPLERNFLKELLDDLKAGLRRE